MGVLQVVFALPSRRLGSLVLWCALLLLQDVSAQSTVAQYGPRNMTFLTAFPTTYIINQAANTRWTVGGNANGVNLYLMDYTGQEVRQTLCTDIPASVEATTSNCTWWPDGTIYPNNNYKIMLNQTGSVNVTAGDVTILAAGTTALSTDPVSWAASTSPVTSSTSSASSPTSASLDTASASSANAQTKDGNGGKGGGGGGGGASIGAAIGYTAAGTSFLAVLAFLIYKKRQTRKTKNMSKLPDEKDDHDSVAASVPSTAGAASKSAVDMTFNKEMERDAKAPVYEMPWKQDPVEMPAIECYELDGTGTQVFEMSEHRKSRHGQ
ncbi:hypothetical protein BP6252_06940 [Coleophoma cylindrospora]|uniref:Mid2 domain-containing protein n=1 Tax=Coleophoma cylindrospora TaxID=1849047 RepID=A0A3D8RG42_9HELO|nr:hypothetical protein BP6252_06940 [Coleophoma cylindrospora]